MSDNVLTNESAAGRDARSPAQPVQVQVQVTTSPRKADIRAATAVAERLHASITIVSSSEGQTVSVPITERGIGWISHHRSKGGLGEVIRQLARHGPRQVRRMARSTVSRSRRTRFIPTPTPTSIEPPLRAVWHILVGLSAAEVLAREPSAAQTDAETVIQLAIGPQFWWGEPWQPALAHRNIQMLALSATVIERGQLRGHLVRYLTVCADDRAPSIAARFSEVAAEMCADLINDDPPLSAGLVCNDSPLSERVIAEDNTTFESRVWTDMVRSITRF